MDKPTLTAPASVSYTHLDVYKRQRQRAIRRILGVAGTGQRQATQYQQRQPRETESEHKRMPFSR